MKTIESSHKTNEKRINRHKQDGSVAVPRHRAPLAEGAHVRFLLNSFVVTFL
jgi:hypothetical protein